MPLPDADYLPLLRAELDAFAATLADDHLGAPVAGCPGWTLRDVVLHLGETHRWARHAVLAGTGDHWPQPGPRDDAGLRAWFADGAGALVETLTRTGPDTACWTLWPPRTARFWRRRQALEALVHRWDAETATGCQPELPADLAADGVDEVVGTMVPRQVRLDRTTWPRQPIALVATDTGHRRVLGAPGDWAVAAAVHGTAADLLLLLWKRRALSGDGLRVDGDADAVRDALDRPLTP
ncbi:maleylpyruvate isomerase family mycothiol-dependent enzyme [Thalassiella azotivora]